MSLKPKKNTKKISLLLTVYNSSISSTEFPFEWHNNVKEFGSWKTLSRSQNGTEDHRTEHLAHKTEHFHRTATCIVHEEYKCFLGG